MQNRATPPFYWATRTPPAPRPWPHGDGLPARRPSLVAAHRTIHVPKDAHAAPTWGGRGRRASVPPSRFAADAVARGDTAAGGGAATWWRKHRLSPPRRPAPCGPPRAGRVLCAATPAAARRALPTLTSVLSPPPPRPRRRCVGEGVWVRAWRSGRGVLRWAGPRSGACVLGGGGGGGRGTSLAPRRGGARRRIVAAGRCGMAAPHDACCCVADDDLSRAALEPGEAKAAVAASAVAGVAVSALAAVPARLLCAH